jgi:DNA-binding CsgD family transcriptional regulator/tetratricopeptide (TPR) repeat protein
MKPLYSRVQTPFVLLERESVLEELSALLGDLKEGVGRVVAVSGEAGIGKTSLLRAFLSTVSENDLILQGGCEDLITSRPLGPLFDMAGYLEPSLLEAMSRDTAFGQVFTQLLIAIQRSAQSVIMVIEDIHWADEATLDLIRFLGRRVTNLSLMLVVTYRDDEPGKDFAIARLLGGLAPQDLVRLQLSPLSEAAVSQLARAANHKHAGLYKVTNGNPFFVTEVLASSGSEIVPGSVRDAVWARFERCSIEQRVALEALSIAPGGASRNLLVQLVTQPQVEQLDELISSGILTLSGSLIRFRHELARQAVLQLLTESRKRHLHSVVGAWLAHQSNALDLPILTQRLHHANAAEESQTVLTFAPMVAKRAARIGAHKQAAQFLNMTLRYCETLPPQDAAQLYESWSYEAGLADRIDMSVIEARHTAIALWEQCGRADKIGLNYRWLSRLHWYRGEAIEAERYIGQAIAILETIEPGPELAWSYSVRSQWAMLNDRYLESVEWGERAIDLARRFDETEIYVHALNNIATSLLLSSDPERGKSLMIESLDLALKHEFHEQAARVYTNMADYALANRDLHLAETYIEAGINFDLEHDLDSWLHYLRGCKARLLMLKGQLVEAKALAEDVLTIPNQTLVMRLPASTVLAQVGVRLGLSTAHDQLLSVLASATTTGEPQRIAPVRIALAEAAWLAGQNQEVLEHVEASLSSQHATHPWDIGELILWAHRAGHHYPISPDTLPEPLRLEYETKLAEAASAYGELELLFERGVALALLERDANDVKGSRLSRIRAHMQGKPVLVRSDGHTRTRAHGLTKKEQEVLQLLRGGASNSEVATKLGRSVRTIEHHVAAILSKMGVTSRSAVIASDGSFVEPDSNSDTARGVAL